VADELGAHTVAFPLVSAGVYGWPKDDAIACALEALRDWQSRSAETDVAEARLVAFDHATYEQIREQLD
jgi:O-acetyl-ADP-ribose deacetylase (regulator of RNase III)